MAEGCRVAVAHAPRPGAGRTLRAGGQRVALFNVGGCYYALDDRCSHMGGPLGEGRLDGVAVICPWHGARFDVRSGAVLAPPAGAPVQAYPVAVQDGQVVVAVDP
jgi:nitrite reductase/ring-hydroxylating ferredoxin subunit